MAKLNDKMFNRVIEGRLYSDKGVPLDTLFDNVVFDESTNTTEVGGNLYVDGEIIKGEPTELFSLLGVTPQYNGQNFYGEINNYDVNQVRDILRKYDVNGFTSDNHSIFHLGYDSGSTSLQPYPNTYFMLIGLSRYTTLDSPVISVVIIKNNEDFTKLMVEYK